MYSNELDREGRILHIKLHEMKRAIRHADREMRHALKSSLKDSSSYFLSVDQARKNETSGPATLDELMTEIESSLSYLEDLPRQKILPYEEMLGKTGDRMVKLKESLKK